MHICCFAFHSSAYLQHLFSQLSIPAFSVFILKHACSFCFHRNAYLQFLFSKLSIISVSVFFFFFFFFFYANHPLQGFRSHCSVRGYYSLLVATAGAEATTRTGRQHTHAHTHTQPPTRFHSEAYLQFLFS